MTKLHYTTLLALSTSCLIQLPLTAHAQDTGPSLDEIIVTSQYRAQGLQDVPISVAAVDANVMEETSIVKMEDLTTLVPNFTYSETGITTTFLIRGIGSGVNQGFEQSVGVYVDGVHYPRGQQARAPFLDLERVEVLRGPQSILFGKNSVAGAMNITTAKPTQEFEASLFSSYEFEDGEAIVEGVVSGPLSDRVRGRIAGRYRDSDGYMENLTLDRDEPSREETTLRGILEVDLTENLMATAKVEYSDFDALGRNIEIENALPVDNALSPFNGLTYPEILVGVFGQDASVLNAEQDGKRHSNGDFSYNKMRTYQLDLDWDLGDFDVKSITALETLDYTENCDCDFTGAVIFDAALQEEYEQFSQEIRITSPEYENYDFIVGAYFQSSDHTYNDQIVVPTNSVLVGAVNASAPGAGSLIAGTQASRTAQVDATVLSAFAQVNYNVTDDVTLQLGGRVTNDNKDGSRVLFAEAQGGGALPAAQAGAAVVYASVFGITTTNLQALAALGDPSSIALTSLLGEGDVPEQNRNTTKFSPDVKLVWDASDDVLLYASWARGYKSGGFDFRANNRGTGESTASTFQFDDEIGTNYEIGGKFKLGSAIELNATAYFSKFEDLQISIFDGILGFNVGNAATSEVKGLEVDGRWAVSDNVRVTGGFAFTDFEFTDFQNGQCYFGQTPDFDNGQCDYTGLANNLVSDFSGNVTMDFDLPILETYELTGLANVFYASAYDAAQTHDPVGRQSGYAKINARLGFGPQDGPWEVAILGKNLTDKIVRTYNGDAPLSGSSFGAKTSYTFYSQGRTVAVQGRVKF